jgi:glycine/D-amino acid oxidase-like deaminating enzyme
MSSVSTIICGAGIAGIATAFELAVKHNQKRVVLVDRYQPMSLTTSKSGENFRDYWPQACMSELSSRSLELMLSLAAESGHAFDLRWSGYDFVSETAGREIFPSRYLDQQHNGVDPVRIIRTGDETGSRPYLANTIEQIAHIERAGAFDVHALGLLLLSRAKRAGVEVRYGMIEGLERIDANYRVSLNSGAGQDIIEAENLVLAAGPFVNELAHMLDIDLPVESYLQRKFVIPDPRGIIPSDMPFTIFADSQFLDWSDEEKELIREDPEYQWLLQEFPAGLHIKPEPGGHIKLGWAFNREPALPKWEVADDFDFPNITLRGASRFIPALKHYVEQPPTPVIQFAGYYTRTPENWPLIGPLELEGLYTVSALSGYGTMTACAAGELCAAWMAGNELPTYARHFHPGRYDDDVIRAEIALVQSDGQL